jgi:di/tricarboxylate transporter
MVMTPGGYRFTDYVKVGLPLILIFLVVSLLLIPLIWPF